MIPRALIPPGVSFPGENAEAAPRRLTTLLDQRTVVASNLPPITLDTHTNIPSHLPLDVLATRIVVPRDTPATPLDAAARHPDHDPFTAMDHRIIVPAALPVVQLQHKGLVAASDLPGVLEPDVLTTGEVNFSIEPIERPSRDWDWVARLGSVVTHGVLLLFVIFQSKLFPYKPPTTQEIENARRQLSFIYMPPDVRGLPRTPPTPSPQLRIDPRALRNAAPSELQPMPAPRQPDRPVRSTPLEPSVQDPPELPSIPAPRIEPSDRPPDFLRGPSVAAQPQQDSGGLVLPRSNSPGRSLEQSAEQALRGGGPSGEFGSTPGGGGLGGGGGNGDLGGALQMLTPTEGVDFTNYLARVLASVKRNWYSIMPESARLGDRGRVMLQFRIMKNGQVPGAEPQLMGSSGKQPLDRAAVSSIRASSPFEPLPPAFSGPYIELRFIFLYNVPLN